MADQAKLVYRLGTPIVFGEAGGTVGGLSVTHTMSLDALPLGSGAGAQMSAEADLGADLPEMLLVELYAESGTAPAAGGTVEGYLAGSRDGTNYPGGVTGSDGDWPADSNEDEWALQLGQPAAQLKATNDGTVIQMQQPTRVPPPGRYIVAVIDNNLSQTFRDEATASNNASGMVVTPLYAFAIDP